MATNSIKHRMLREARKIASMKFEGKRTVHRGLDGSISSETYYPATYFMNLEIEKVLEKHPEFDSDNFRTMIKKYMQENKEKEEKFLGG